MAHTTRIPHGYKHTEVGIIPNDWEVKALKDIAPLQRGFDLPNSKLAPGKYPVVYSNGIINHHNEYKAKGPGVITGRSGTIGNVHYVEENYWPHNTSLWVTEFKGNDPLFIYYLYSSIKLSRFGSGSGVPTLNRNDVHDFTVAIPKPTEQTAIATALHDADALINSLERLIAKKRHIKHGAMQELLKPKAGWEVKTLGEVLKVRHGKSQKDVRDDNGVYPILASGGVIGQAKRFLYDKPSVLIGRKGTIDQPQFMSTPFWSVDTLFYTEVFEGYDAKFIFYMFNLIDWYSYNEASGVPSLNAKTIEMIERGFPKTISEQIRIAQILSDIDAEIDALERQLAKYRLIKQGMMQNLLTGRIRLV